jgi:hypothetical protein
VVALGAHGSYWRTFSMDSRSFDSLARRVAGALNRRRLIASSAVAGATALLAQGTDVTLGKDHNHKNNNDKKKTICHCPGSTPEGCKTIKVKKRSAKKHLKNHCDYAGACRAGFNPCTPQTLCTNDDQCSASDVCRNGACVPGCKTQADCTDGFQCKNGGCVCEANKVLCGGQCVDLTTDNDNCGECGRACDNGDVCSNGFTCQPAECLAVTELENDVRLDDDGGLRLVAASSGPNPPYVYGAVGFEVPDNITFADISSITSGYQFVSGACGAGTPRFCVRFSTRDDCVCGQFPASTTNCEETGSVGNTGNLIGNETPFDWFSLCGSDKVTNTYADALAEFGDDTVREIFLVADSSNGTQVVIVEPCITTS